jgi:hypothetical protein
MKHGTFRQRGRRIARCSHVFCWKRGRRPRFQQKACERRAIRTPATSSGASTRARAKLSGVHRPCSILGESDSLPNVLNVRAIIGNRMLPAKSAFSESEHFPPTMSQQPTANICIFQKVNISRQVSPPRGTFRRFGELWGTFRRFGELFAKFRRFGELFAKFRHRGELWGTFRHFVAVRGTLGKKTCKIV